MAVFLRHVFRNAILLCLPFNVKGHICMGIHISYLGISTHAGPGVVIPLTCLEFLPNCIDWKPKGEEPYSRLLKMKLTYYV